MATRKSPTRKIQANTPSNMERPLGATESLFYLLDKIYCLNFVVYAEVVGTLPPDALDQALALAQQEHPLLRTRINGNASRLVFKAIDAEAHPLRATWQPWSSRKLLLERQLDTPFDQELPLMRCFAFLDKKAKPVRQILAMVFQHTIADGRSGTQLLLDVLCRATGAAMPLSPRDANPSAQALSISADKSRLTDELGKARFWIGEGLKSLRPVATLPGFSHKLGGDRDMRVLTMKLSKIQATNLVKRARAAGTTMHGALGAAQMLALCDEISATGGRESRRVALNSLADLRDSLSGGLTEHDLGLYIATLTTVHEIDDTPGLFWRLAVDVRAQLKNVIDRGDANLINSIYRENMLLPSTSLGGRVMQGVAALAPSASMLTNIGRIDIPELANGASVSSIEFTVSPPPHNPFCITAASHAGVVHMNMVFDANQLTPEQASRLSKNFLNHLKKAIRD